MIFFYRHTSFVLCRLQVRSLRSVVICFVLNISVSVRRLRNANTADKKLTAGSFGGYSVHFGPPCLKFNLQIRNLYLGSVNNDAEWMVHV